jgi:hypothetical protein
VRALNLDFRRVNSLPDFESDRKFEQLEVLPFYRALEVLRVIRGVSKSANFKYTNNINRVACGGGRVVSRRRFVVSKNLS